jgi:uncharacterized damage-inducible protein DinB
MPAMTETPTRLGRHAQWLFADYLGKIETCLGLLDDRQLWQRPASRCNSIGNIVLHLEGNLSQWVLAGLGGAAYERSRSAEFAACAGPGRDELLARLRDVVLRCQEVAGALREEELLQRRVIQGYQRDGFGALLHAVEHMSYHTGQVVHITKELLGEGCEIEFYPHLKGT